MCSVYCGILPSRSHGRRNINTMASSIAQKRLFHEYKLLSTSPPDGITAGPITEDDMFLWEALIQGPEGTPFEGGVFAAELKFPKDYPLSPPSMRFLGNMWHPNSKIELPFPTILNSARSRSICSNINLQYLKTETFAFLFYTRRATTQTTTSTHLSGGVRFRVSRRSL